MMGICMWNNICPYCLIFMLLFFVNYVALSKVCKVYTLPNLGTELTGHWKSTFEQPL